MTNHTQAEQMIQEKRREGNWCVAVDHTGKILFFSCSVLVVAYRDCFKQVEQLKSPVAIDMWHER